MSELVSRRRFLGRAGVVAGLGVTGALGDAVASPAAESHATAAPAPAISPRTALRLLLEGNRRWVRGRARHPNQSVPRRRRLAASQAPFAVVFSCIDSRVPPELVFDRGIGDLFTTRTGAQTVDNVALGSVEYGPVENGTPLIVVLGHQACGAVIAAIGAIQQRAEAPGHIGALVEALRPAYDVASTQPGDLVDNTVRAQTKLTVATLRQQPDLAGLVATGRLLIVGGRYSLDSGRVELIA